MSHVIRRQRLLLALCGVTATLIAIATWMTLFVAGAPGGRLEPTGEPFVERIGLIERRSPADLASVRNGDIIDLRGLSAADRLRVANGMLVGEQIVLPIRHGDVRRLVTLTAWPMTKGRFWREDGWDQLLSMVGELWAVLVGALIVWRRPANPEALILALSLILGSFGVVLSPQNYWVTPWPVLDLACYAVGIPIAIIGTTLLATYALRFGQPVSVTRRIVTWVTYALTALDALEIFVGVLGEWFGAIDSTQWYFAQIVPSLAVNLGTLLLPLVCVVLAVRDARGSDRARVAWAGGMLSIQFFASAVFVITQTTGAYVHEGDLIVDVATFVAPLGLTYALLNRRLLDLGFVLNRAAVFTAISLTIVGAFTLVEWALGNWLQSASKSTNLAVSAALALALGLSVHPIHGWVDRFIDNVFFRKRHEDEQALRRFAHEAAFTTDPGAIVERAKRELRDHAGSASVDVVVYDGAGRYGDVDENDLALVALRASGEVLDLHGIETALRGERAYPMLARGRFVGALVVGQKHTGESYAPDESAAMAEVAHGVGVALDLLGVGRNDSQVHLVDAIVALEDAVRNLPSAIVERMRVAIREDRTDDYVPFSAPK